MDKFLLEAQSLRKSYNHRTVFFDVSFSLRFRNGLGIAGRNGSGKTTLAKIIAGILFPTTGRIQYSLGTNVIENNTLQDYVGFVAPYLQLYDEFTAWENLDLARRIRGVKIPNDRLRALLERVNLADRKDGLVRTYSSGMKQRLKYAFALLHQPSLLILDEPSSNLDSEGIQIVEQIMKEQVERGILVVATNESEDLSYCTQTLDLNVFFDPLQQKRGEIQ